MSFTEIIKHSYGADAIPNNILRINTKTVALSANIAEQFQSQRTTLETGREKIILGLAYDVEAKQLKIIPNSVNGFSFTTGPNATGTLSVAMPGTLKRLVREGKFQIGDYVLTDNQNLVFTLAE